MITNPLSNTAPVAHATAAASSSTPKAKSPTDLGPNAFITLLTAQLQAQNPLNPMDPNQMVSELTSMNTLQETIQIRQDLDKLANPPATTPPTTPPPASGSAAASAMHASANTASASAASSALSAGLAALTKSLAPSSVAPFPSSINASPSNSKSLLF
jgi:flagellar basal-body rod modification protein FlgD